MIYLDTETELITPYVRAPRLVVLAVDHGFGVRLYPWNECEHLAACTLEDPVVKVGHYIAYDMTVLGAQFPELLPEIFQAYREDRITDTGIRQKLLETALGTRTKASRYSLADVAARVTGAKKDANDPWRLRYGEIRDVQISEWPADAVAYVRKDVTVLGPIYAVQSGARLACAPDANPLADEFRQARADFALALMSAWGLETDQRKVDRLETFIHEEHDALEAHLVRVGLAESKRKRDPLGEIKRNMKVAKERMAVAYPDCPRTDPSESFPEGQLKIDETTCEESGDPDLAVLGKYGALHAVLTKDVPMLRRPIVHSRYEVCVTSGRTSSSDPNIQNLKVVQYGEKDPVTRKPIGPQYGIRECFAPRPGMVFISADYSGLELATWARVCLDLFGFSSMAEMLIAGIDPHTNFAATIMGVPYDDARARREDADVYPNRQTGKVFNFGKPGGLGARTLVAQAKSIYRVDLTEARAKQLGEVWLNTYREARPYFDLMKRITANGNGTVEQVRSVRFRGGLRFTQACNTLFQGLGADVAKAALFDVAEECYVDKGTPLFGVRPVAFIHDEILCEAPEATAPEAADRLSAVMVAAALPWLGEIPIVAEPKVHRVWSKGAKSKRGADGRLQIWEP